jgi:hypothetical protein
LLSGYFFSSFPGKAWSAPMKVKCEFCGEGQDQKERCGFCGAPLPEKNGQEAWVRVEPFYLYGYFVWPEINYAKMSTRFFFYLGDRLVDTMEISRRSIEELVSPGESIDTLLISLLKVSQGEEEVLRIQSRNAERNTLFEIRKIEMKQRSEIGWSQYAVNSMDSLSVLKGS